MDFSSFLTIIQTIIILVLVIGIANVSLKYVNKNMIRQNKLIKVIEKVALSNTSSIGVVVICNSYYLMSFTASDNKILKELDKEQVEDNIQDMQAIKDLQVSENFLRNMLGARDKE